MRDSNSKNAQKMREYRARKQEREVKSLMKKWGLTKREATILYQKRTREKNTRDRRELRASKRKPKTEPEKEEEKKETTIDKVDTKKSVKPSKTHLGLKIENLLLLDDDKRSWDSLTTPLKRVVNSMYISNGYSKPRSLIQYVKKVKSIYKKLGKEFTGNNISPLFNISNIDNLLSDLSSRKDYYAAIIAVLKAYRRTDKYVRHYREKMMAGINEIEKREKDNKKTESQNKNWMSERDIINSLRMNRNMLNSKDLLLMTLIIYYPRRLQDYQKMKLHIGRGEKDRNYNYLNFKGRDPTTFDFFRTKSQYYEKLGTSHKIPEKIKSAIKKYVRENKVKNNQLLFGDKDGNVIPVDQFSRKVKKLFLILTGREITMNLYRHIVSTTLTDKGASLNERELRANQLGHSLIESLKYSKHK